MPGPFYRPRYGADLELACLDTSRDTEQEEIHRYLQAPKHLQWRRPTFGRRGDRWLIPYSHHLVYSAGPTIKTTTHNCLGRLRPRWRSEAWSGCSPEDLPPWPACFR